MNAEDDVLMTIIMILIMDMSVLLKTMKLRLILASWSPPLPHFSWGLDILIHGAPLGQMVCVHVQ